MKFTEIKKLVEDEFDLILNPKDTNKDFWEWEDKKALRRRLYRVELTEELMGVLEINIHNQKELEFTVRLIRVNEMSVEKIKEFIKYVYDNFLWNENI